MWRNWWRQYKSEWADLIYIGIGVSVVYAVGNAFFR